MADFLNNPFVNAGMGLGGGLGAMPVAAPYTTAGVIPGAAMQFRNMKEAIPYMAGLFGGAGAAGGAMAMQPKSSNTEYAPFGGDTAPQTEYAPFGGDTAPASPQQQTPDSSGMSEMDMYRMASGALQGMGRGMQQQMPSGNTAQIMRDQNQFRFAGMQQNPQMLAQALRNRG